MADLRVRLVPHKDKIACMDIQDWCVSHASFTTLIASCFYEKPGSLFADCGLPKPCRVNG